jgi:hypothetical protein
MSWSNPNAPNLPDFLLFLADSVQIPATALPANSPWPGYAFNRAINIVMTVPTMPGLEYTMAVYNCATHILIRIAPDQPMQTYFASLRDSFKIPAASSGVIASTSDEGTSNSFSVPPNLTNLTVGDLDFFKTPWGREYLSYAMDFGCIVGLS